MGNWLRRLRQAPLFNLPVVLTLALGLGANTAIFTLINGILLRRLPVAHPEQLYRLGDDSDCCVEGGFQNDNGDTDIFSYAMYRQFEAQTPEFSSLAAVQAGRPTFAVRHGTAPAQ